MQVRIVFFVLETTWLTSITVKCFSSTVNGTKTLSLTAFVTSLDIISDIMGVYYSTRTTASVYFKKLISW